MITFTNPWGTTEENEVQRTDLWTLSMYPVTQLVLNPDGVDTTGEYDYFRRQALTGNVADFYTQKIVLPENVINTIEVIRGTQKIFTPGYDEPLGVTRIDFFHEVVDNPDQLVQSSRIYNLLRCWWMLAMAGQQRFDRVILPLLSEADVPTFKVDLELTFHKGTDPDVAALDDAAVYQLLDCWISDLQIMDFDYHNRGEPAFVTATLQVGSILPRPTS
jgi:hypothetical protein